MNDIYNAHTHVFTGQCAPKDFLQVGLNMGDGMSKMLKWLFMTKPVSWIVLKAGNTIPAKKLQFLKIGVMATQEEVLKNLFSNYANTPYHDIKIIGLSIDMDYMTDAENAPNQDFNSQIWGVVNLKKTYPDRFFPFYGIDPRNPETKHPTRLKTFINNKTFSGIKLYPPKGYFPFDPRMDEVYRFAEQNKIPVMTHCTRTGSYYVGDNVWTLIPDKPDSLNGSSPFMADVQKRIANYKKASSKIFKQNERICNLFSHPLNYRPILEKFPDLKICFAHLGGEMEIMGSKHPDAKTRHLYNDILKLEGGTKSWYEHLKDLQKEYKNVYTDISYTLSSEMSLKQIAADLSNGTLDPARVLFGTDYFMVQQEDSEMKVVSNAETILGSYFNAMKSDNVKNYLYA